MKNKIYLVLGLLFLALTCHGVSYIFRKSELYKLETPIVETYRFARKKVLSTTSAYTIDLKEIIRGDRTLWL